MILELDKEFTVENSSGVMKLKVLEETSLQNVGAYNGLGEAKGVRIELYNEDIFSVYSNEWENTIYFFTTAYGEKHCWKCEIIETEQLKSDIKLCKEQW